MKKYENECVVILAKLKYQNFKSKAESKVF